MMLYYNVTPSIAMTMRFLPFLICLLLPCVSLAAVSVVTSIKPLQQISAAIMQGVANPAQLIDSTQSAHHFSFRPSHLRLLQQANLVIWVDRHFESGFQRITNRLSSTQSHLELLPALGLSNKDGHIWYSPELLRRSGQLIADKLVEIDGINADIYRKNLREFHQKIDNWEEKSKQAFRELKPRYLLDHNFLHHFEAFYGLQAIATIHDSHDQHGGIQALKNIETRLNADQANCLISNEAEISGIGRNLAAKFNLKTHSLKTQAGLFDELNQLNAILVGC